MQDELIIQQLKSGQPTKVLEELYKAFPAIRHFIKTHGGNDDDARDVFQESLIILFRNVQQREFKLTSSLNTYLYSVSKYMWKDLLKKKNKEVSFSIDDFPIQDIEQIKEEDVKWKWLDKILVSLGDKCAEILKLYYYGKLSMNEIATKLAYRNVDTAKTQKYKCLERARTMANELSVKAEKETL